MTKFDMAYEMERLNPKMPYTVMIDAFTKAELKEMYEELKNKNYGD